MGMISIHIGRAGNKLSRAWHGSVADRARFSLTHLFHKFKNDGRLDSTRLEVGLRAGLAREQYSSKYYCIIK